MLSRSKNNSWFNYVSLIAGVAVLSELPEEFLSLNIGTFYQVLKSRPYVKEKKELFKKAEETIQGGGDCDDFTIATLAYCIKKNIPCRIVLGRQRFAKSFHHVFTKVYDSSINRYRNFDIIADSLDKTVLDLVETREYAISWRSSRK